MAKKKTPEKVIEFDTFAGRVSFSKSKEIVWIYQIYGDYLFPKYVKDLISGHDSKPDDLVLVHTDFTSLESCLNGNQDSWDIFEPPKHVEQILSNFMDHDHYTDALKAVEEQIKESLVIFDMVDSVLEWAEKHPEIDIRNYRNHAASRDLNPNEIGDIVDQIYGVIRRKGEPGRFKPQLHALLRGEIVSAETLIMLGEHVDPMFSTLVRDPLEDAKDSLDYQFVLFIQKAVGTVLTQLIPGEEDLEFRYKGITASEKNIDEAIGTNIRRRGIDYTLTRVHPREEHHDLMPLQSVSYSKGETIPRSLRGKVRTLEDIAVDMVTLAQILYESIVAYVKDKNPGFSSDTLADINTSVIHKVVPNYNFFHIMCGHSNTPSSSLGFYMDNPKRVVSQTIRDYNANTIPTIVDSTKLSLSVSSIRSYMYQLADNLPPELLEAMGAREMLNNPDRIESLKTPRQIINLRQHQSSLYGSLKDIGINRSNIPGYSTEISTERKMKTISTYFA